MRAVLTIPIAALAIGAAVPASAQFKPGVKDQIQLGQRAADEVRKKERVLPSSDPRVQTVRRVADRLLSAVHDKEDWQYSFDVIDNKQVNAFALPGGPTFVYTGLLNRFESEDELAAVMAHELTHTRKQHWATAYNDSQKRNLGLNLLLILTRANRTISGIAGITNEVVFTLPFSRRMEEEADSEGLKMLVNAGYNPWAMADVFRTLKSASGGGKPPEFLSSHPTDDRRIARIENIIRGMNRNFPPERPLRFRGGQWWQE